jgi:nicotinamidase-related amidase
MREMQGVADVKERRLTARTTDNVVRLRPFVDPLAVPTVVLVDLQQEYVAAPRRMAVPDASAALAQCSLLLAHARVMGFPVAFMKRVTHAPFFNAATRFSHWIDGFSPLPAEMVFERELPSCYANSDFACLMNEGAGVNMVLAGFAGESACLSTVIDAYHRGHRVTFLADASASHAVESVAAASVHGLLSKVLGLYGAVATTAEWIAATSQWPIASGLGYGAESHEAG